MNTYIVRFNSCTYRSCIVKAPDQQTAELEARLILTTNIDVSPEWLEDAQLTDIEEITDYEIIGELKLCKP